MASYTLGFPRPEDTWMVLPAPYHHYTSSTGTNIPIGVTGSAAASMSMSSMTMTQMNMNPMTDFTLASSLQQRRSPLSSAAYTHSCILEMRKEKSRDAARSRRGKENYEFYELAKLLPLPAAITSQLDKASIIRLTISFLRLKDFSAHGEPPWNRDTAPKTAKGHRLRNNHNVTMELFDMHQGTHILQSLDGFAFALGTDGRFLYISETVSIYLGLSQVEMTGSSIFDYIHAADQAELAEQLGLTLTSTGTSSGGGGASSTSSQLPASPASGTGSVGGASEEGSGSTLNPDVSAVMSFGSNSGYKGLDRCFCIRMKSTLTKRGCHFKSSGYRVVMVLCRLRPQSQFVNNSKSSPQLLGLVALAIALPPPTIHELRLEPDMFVTRLSFDFRIAHCEPRVADLMDYTAEDIIGRSLYGLCHAEDVQGLRKCHVDLLHKGQVMTPYYRLMNRRGGYSWIQSCATVVCSSKNGDEQSIICVNYVVSRPEYTNLVFDNCQLENSLPMPIKPEETETPSVEDSRPELSTIEDVRSELHSPGADLNQDPPPALEPIEKPSEGSSPHSNSPSTPCPQPVAVKKSRSLKRKLEPELQLKTPSNSSTAMSTSMNVELESYDRHEHSTTGNPREDERWNNRPTESQQAALNTDFSTDALLAKRSTIQWIGNAPPATSSSAISILRQIYASRESVIRANVHANRVANGSFFGNENMAGGTSGASVEYPHHDVFQGSYSTNYSLPDYLPAMTPPASVSPREGAPPILHPYLGETPFATPTPLKPSHMYGVHGLDTTTPSQYPGPPPLGLADSSAFYTHGGSGFHLYHNQTGKTSHYGDVLKNGTGWYSST